MLRFKRQSVLSAVCLNGEKSVFVFEGTLDKVLFVLCLRVCLVPMFGSE
jgi:hypothetical protein